MLDTGSFDVDLQQKIDLISQSKHNYVVGSQKNRLNEKVLLSTQTYVKTDG